MCQGGEAGAHDLRVAEAVGHELLDPADPVAFDVREVGQVLVGHGWEGHEPDCRGFNVDADDAVGCHAADVRTDYRTEVTALHADRGDAGRRRARRPTQRTADRPRALADVLRTDITAPDLAVVFEMVAAVRLDDDRSHRLRRRFLAIALRGLRPGDGGLPGEPPTWNELGARWER